MSDAKSNSFKILPHISQKPLDSSRQDIQPGKGVVSGQKSPREGGKTLCGGPASQYSPSRAKRTREEGLSGDALMHSLSQKWIRLREMKDDLAGSRD